MSDDHQSPDAEKLTIQKDSLTLLRESEARLAEAQLIAHLGSYDEADEPVRVLGTSQDETELRLAEMQTARKVEQLAALNEMGQVAVANLELNVILAQVGEKMRKLLRAECILMLLLTTDGQHLRIEHVSGEGFSHLQGSEIPLAAKLARSAVQSNKAILVQSAEEVTRCAPFLQAKRGGESVEAVLAAPLRFQERLLGLVVATHRQEDGFVLHDLFVLDTAVAWTSIAINNASLYQSLSCRELRLRELAGQLFREQEAERQRTAYELHDETGQTLTALKWKLEMVMADLHDSSLRTELTEVAVLVTQVMERIRHLAYDLRPPELDIVGLDAALRTLCERFAKRTAVAIEYKGLSLQPNVPEEIQLSFYRFLQEALTNVAKHAQATQVRVQLKQQQQLSLAVADNGRGFNVEEETAVPNSGLGLLSIRERFEWLGGSLTIESEEKTGTKLVASVKL